VQQALPMPMATLQHMFATKGGSLKGRITQIACLINISGAPGDLLFVPKNSNTTQPQIQRNMQVESCSLEDKNKQLQACPLGMLLFSLAFVLYFTAG
jgi:hypothetical protein